jgi:hypothetical protein
VTVVTLFHGMCDSHRDVHVLFAASGDIRNVIKFVVEGLPNQYNGQCVVVINISIYVYRSQHYSSDHSVEF